MTKTTWALIAACCLTGGAAMSQETETAEPETATPPGGALVVAQPEGPQPGQVYQRETHGDWAVRCVKAPEGQDDQCQLFQRLADQQGNPTADINFFDLPNGGQVEGGATVVTPLQTLLTTQVSLSVDGGSERRYPFSFCDAQGCYSRMGFTPAEMAQFRAGAKGEIRIRPALAPDQEVVMSVSLTGFTAGMQAVTLPEE